MTRLVERTLTFYANESGSFAFSVKNDYTDQEIRLIFETFDRADQLVVDDAEMSKGISTLTFNSGATFLQTPHKGRWSIRDVATNQRLESGRYFVWYTPEVD